MTSSDRQAFFEKYAPMAMEQQVRYGIPASVTLAQMALESGYGKGRAILEANNAFCVKAGSSKYWNEEGHYVLISDDRKDEKFRKYQTLEQSFNDHSQVLMGRHYAHCRSLASTDYEGWCKGLQSGASTGGRYASDSKYSASLMGIIESNGLQEYDQKALVLAKRQNHEVGYARGRDVQPPSMDGTATAAASQQISTIGYCLPVGDGSKIEVTSLYGHRDSPTAGASSNHKGIDIRAKYTDVFSMERGTVVAVGSDAKSGKFVMVEYERTDGRNYMVSYCHLDKIAVSKDQTVEAGQVIARSGATGVGTGPHLHLTVKQKDGDSYQHIDPLDYLAEISVRGGLTGKVVKSGNGFDLLASRRAGVDTTPTPHEVLLAQQAGTLNEQQRQNAEAAVSDGRHDGNTLAAFGGLGSNNILKQLMDGDGLMSGNGDLITTLLHAIFVSSLAMASMFGKGSSEARQDDGAREQEPETGEQRAATLIMRQRESVDAGKARQYAMMNFDAECPEQSQGTGQRLV